MDKYRVGFAVCGSFCTYQSVLEPLKELADIYDVFPIVSQSVANTDTRFGGAEEYIAKLKHICKKEVISTIKDAEPIGPKKLLDMLIIAPCTGNTLAKMACGICDTPVTMAAKAHLRNSRPVLLAVSTNDGLGANALSIAQLMQRKNVFFVPFGQDGPLSKPKSLLSVMKMLPACTEAALRGEQMQPLLQGVIEGD